MARRTPKLTPHGDLLLLAGRIAGTISLLEAERSWLPQDAAYLYACADRDELAQLEAAHDTLVALAARRGGPGS